MMFCAAPLEPQALPGKSGEIRSLIIEDKLLCRALMGQFVSAHPRLGPIDFAASCDEAVQQVYLDRPGLILVDLATIGYDFRDLRALTSCVPGALILAIDERASPEFARRARAAGAAGYAAKTFSPETVREILDALLRGGTPPEIPGMEAAPAAADRLSPRQREVLAEIATGAGNQEIAEALGIAVGTVKLHIHAILKITGARNRTDAALKARRILASGAPAGRIGAGDGEP